MIGLLAMAAAATASSGTVPSFKNGNDLYEVCRAHSVSCDYYVVGVSDAFATLVSIGVASAKVICLPEHATGVQLTDVFTKYLEDNPAARAGDGGGLVLTALSRAFPCPK